MFHRCTRYPRKAATFSWVTVIVEEALSETPYETGCDYVVRQRRGGLAGCQCGFSSGNRLWPPLGPLGAA
jgi:hypothetical protein